MYRRQSIYNNSQENVNLNALAAAAALGKALSPDGREVDHSKIPFYKSSNRVTAMTNINRSSSITNRHRSQLNSITRHNSMYVSTNEVLQRQEKKRIIIPSYRQTTTNNNNRRTSSLPSSSSTRRNHGKVAAVETKNVHKAFQEFGGPQSVSINSFSNKRNIKKYIPGPNGLIAIDVPIDDDIKRRQRGSYSITTGYLDARNSHSKINYGSRSNSGLHNNINNNDNNNMTQPRIRTRVSSVLLTNNNNSNYNNKTSNSVNKNPYQKNDLTLKKQRSTASLTSKNQKKSSNNLTLDQNKYTKVNVTNRKAINHKESSSKNNLTASTLHSSKENINNKRTVSLPMIESSMPEETELELELDSDNVGSSNLKKLDTPSKIELSELIEETIELEEKLNEDLMSNDEPKPPDVSDRTTIEQYNSSDKIANNKLPNENKTVLDINSIDSQTYSNNDIHTSDFDAIHKDEIYQSDEEISITSLSDTHVGEGTIEKVSNDLVHVSNKSDVSSSFDQEESTVNHKIENINIDRSNQDTNLSVLSEKSVNKTCASKKINLLGNESNRAKNKAVNEQQNGKPKNINKLVTDEPQEKQVEELGLQVMNHSYLDGDQISENIRGGSSDYVSTEEYPNEDAPKAPIPPPISPKRHRKTAHPVRDDLQDVITDAKTTEKHLSSQSENIMKDTLKQDNDHSQNKESITIKKNRTTMADYLRSANPYLSKKDNLNFKAQSSISKKDTYSTPKKKTIRSPSLSPPSKKPITKHSIPSIDLKPPPRFSQNITPIKSALKKTQSYNSDSSVYDDNPANDAYLSLTTAENTRLNARMSNENLVSRKISIKKVKRPQSMVTQATQKPQSPPSKDNKKKSAVITRRSSLIRNSKSTDNSKIVKQQSQLDPDKAASAHEELVITKAKKLVQDPKMSLALYPIEPIPTKSSFEKLRPEKNHLGFKNLSLRTDITNETEYEQSNMNNKFHQNKASVSYPINQQQRTQQMQPLTSTIGYGLSSGWTSRFQDSDSDDDYTFSQSNYFKSNGKSSSKSSKVLSPSKLKSNGFSLFKNTKHHELQEPPDKSSYETPKLSNNSKLDRTIMRTASATDQLTPTSKSELKASPQRVLSEPQLKGSEKIYSDQHIEDGDHKRAHNKFGNKLRKLFGRKK
ncbi:Seg1p PWA37_004156 [Arxiozyma heterogenica]|uniref:Eisosome protein SEG2 n=1 Tax=Arxiozyma heterogenica TaxID=278026 RepID=A0AAN7W1F5_9SACH|nr:hypothetical protein RI543_003174 [Kazachstania heterogenica]